MQLLQHSTVARDLFADPYTGKLWIEQGKDAIDYPWQQQQQQQQSVLDTKPWWSMSKWWWQGVKEWQQQQQQQQQRDYPVFQMLAACGMSLDQVMSRLPGHGISQSHM